MKAKSSILGLPNKYKGIDRERQEEFSKMWKEHKDTWFELGYEQGKKDQAKKDKVLHRNLEDQYKNVRQKQIEVLEKVIKKCELWGQFYLDDFEDWLEEELRRLSK
jgi:hypothetical protein